MTVALRWLQQQVSKGSQSDPYSWERATLILPGLLCCPPTNRQGLEYDPRQ